MSSYRFLLNNIFWLSAVRIFTKITSLITLPIITYYLSPKDFGIMAMVSVVQSFLSGIFSMGLISYAGRIIYRYERNDLKECKECLGALFIYILIFSIAGLIIAFYFVDEMVNLFIAQIVFPERIYLFIPIFMAFVMTIYSFISNNIINFQASKKIFYLESMQFILFVPIQIIGLCYWEYNVWDIIVLQAVVQVVITCYGLWLIRSWLSFSIKKMNIFKEAMKYSLPMVPLDFLGWVQDRIDKIYINNFISLNAVGIYTAGVNIANQYSFLSRPLMTAIKPEISKRLDNNDQNIQSDIKDAFLIFFQFSLFLYFVMSLFSREIVQILMDDKFYECYKIIPIFLLSIIFSELIGIFHLKFIFTNKTIWFPVTLCVSAILNVLLNYLMIPIFSVYGAAFAKTMTEGFLLILTYFVAQRLHKTDYRFIKNFLPILPIVMMVYVINLLNINLICLILLKSGMIILYVFILDLVLARNSTRYFYIRGLVKRNVLVNVKRICKAS